MNKIKHWLTQIDNTKKATILFVCISFLLIISITIVNAVNGSHENNTSDKIVDQHKGKQEKQPAKKTEDKQEEGTSKDSDHEVESNTMVDEQINTNNDAIINDTTPSQNTATTNANQNTTTQQQRIHVNVSVIGMNNHVIASGSMQLETNKSAYEGLSIFASQNNLSITTSGFGPYVYVTGINDLVEHGHGASSGWMYSINGVSINTGAGKYQLQDGDQMVWYYVFD